jgi:bifunctional DNA-binding transcriptional regulator/antitoxin component of YhaV-PrlF toxin-antitoxin module
LRITSKGQVTIPQGIREQTAGLLPHTEVDFIVDRGTSDPTIADRVGLRALLIHWT